MTKKKEILIPNPHESLPKTQLTLMPLMPTNIKLYPSNRPIFVGLRGSFNPHDYDFKIQL